MMKNEVMDIFKSGIYAITPDIDDLGRLTSLVEQALSGGIRLFQYRNKVSTRDQRRLVAQRLNDIIESSGGSLIINDDPHLANEVSARGVHIGREDAALEVARGILGPKKIIGVSCYDNLEIALEMQERGADYLAFGAFFPSLSKSSATPVSLDILGLVRTYGIKIPVVAIGGVNLNNAEELLIEGTSALAVINGLFGADDVESRAREWISFINIKRIQIRSKG
ncbi:MAG: thiamine phosphate synthase [Proteobacteria bacterium]|nr:thiamine phosphate synthase [Pseudomonadota bacterium]